MSAACRFGCPDDFHADYCPHNPDHANEETDAPIADKTIAELMDERDSLRAQLSEAVALLRRAKGNFRIATPMALDDDIETFLSRIDAAEGLAEGKAIADRWIEQAGGPLPRIDGKDGAR